MRKVFIIALIFAFCPALYAAEPEGTQSKPSTKLEAFAAKTGIVVIKGFSTIGTIRGVYGGQVSLDARDFRNASDPKSKEYGITIEVKESGRLERENTSFIDYDEISSLLAGIDYISKVDNKITSLSNFEATYKTKGDFSITTFTSPKGGIGVALASGRIGRTSVFITTADLGTLRGYIVTAKEKIDAIK